MVSGVPPSVHHSLLLPFQWNHKHGRNGEIKQDHYSQIGKVKWQKISHKQRPEDHTGRRPHLDGSWWSVCWVMVSLSSAAQWLVAQKLSAAPPLSQVEAVVMSKYSGDCLFSGEAAPWPLSQGRDLIPFL